jgi:alkanesulfonate monooxygenase
VPIEFVHAAALNPSTELNGLGQVGVDGEYFRNYVREMDVLGYDHVLLAYGAATPDPFALAAVALETTEQLGAFIALRPNLMAPTFAAKAAATLDQLSGGRVAYHLIAGGRAAEQAREGDRASKPQRYERMGEAMDILRRAWADPTPFDYHGEYFDIEDFNNAVVPVQSHIRIGVGGASPEAHTVVGEKGDFYGMWAEPLDETERIIARIRDIAAAADRTPPAFWATFRPIVAPTEREAWEKAWRIVEVLRKRTSAGVGNPWALGVPKTESQATRRVLEAHGEGALHDRATWFETSAAALGIGTTTALVGSYETVAAAILDYVDAGVEIIGMRGYDNLADMREYGREVIPLVRAELAHREATGERGRIVPQPEYQRGPHAEPFPDLRVAQLAELAGQR